MSKGRLQNAMTLKQNVFLKSIFYLQTKCIPPVRHTIPRRPQFHTGIQGIRNDKYIIYIYFSSQERKLSSQAKLYTCSYHSGDKLNVRMNRGRLFSNKTSLQGSCLCIV